MNQHTQHPPLGDPKALQLYDLLMATIEPELTSSRIAEIDALAAKDTVEEKKQRLERYEEAFALYDELVAEVSRLAKEDAQQKKQEMRSNLRKSEQAQHTQDMDHIEHLFSQDA